MSTPPDDEQWLADLERRTDELREALMGWREARQEPAPPPVPGDDYEPEFEEVWDFVHDILVPEIDRALRAYEGGHAQKDMFTWQVGLLAVTVNITADSNGVLIESSMQWYARKLYNHYTYLGYVVVPLDHTDDTTMQQPKRVRIFITPVGPT